MAGSLLLCIHAGTFGHGSLVKGHVSDSTSDRALVGATIVLGANQDISITDELGNFKFDNLAPGTYHVRVSYIAIARRK